MEAQVKYLVTGGVGFIGSHLCEYLLDRGHQVHVIDNLSTGRLENVEHLHDHPRFRLTVDSILNPFAMEPLIQDADMVFHLAAAVGVKLVIEQPVATMETNLMGTEVVLKLAAKHGKKVLVTSTSEVYGKNSKLPFEEDDDCTYGPSTTGRWCYAYSKALDEFMAFAYLQERRLPVVIARLFNTVGPRQTGSYGMVVPRFVRAALLGEPLTVYGTGEQSRCFSHVADVAGAIADLLGCPEAVGEVVNIGTEHSITINALAEKVIAMTGSGSEIRHLSYEEAYGRPFDDMLIRKPDLSKARRLIGYEPTKGLDETLTDIIDYQRASLGAEG